MPVTTFRQQLTRILERYAKVPAKEAVLLEQSLNEISIFDTEVLLDSSTLADGSVGYASDTDEFKFRKGSAWLNSPNTGIAATDELVKVSANDTTAALLGTKLVAGANITLNEINDGANETLEIVAAATAAAGVSGSIQLSDGAGGFIADGTKLFWDDTNDRLGVGKNTPSAVLEVGQDVTGATGLLAGQLQVSAQTYTDNATAGSGTAAAWAGIGLQQPTLAATNLTVTTTDAATLYVADAPTAGTNMTLTNAYAAWFDAGDVRVDGNILMAAGVEATPSLTPLGDPNTGMWSPVADTLAWSTGGSEAMRIDSVGRVGINVTPSAAQLHVDGAVKIDTGLLTVNAGANISGTVQFLSGSTTFAGTHPLNLQSLTTAFSTLLLRDGVELHFGTAGDSQVEYSSLQTNDAVTWGLSADSRSIIFIEVADQAVNWGHAAQTEPTIFIQSVTQATPAKHLRLQYDLIDAGTGPLRIAIADSEAMQIDASRRLGVNEQTPDELVHFTDGHLKNDQTSLPTTTLTSTTLNDGAGSGASIVVTAGGTDQAGKVTITAGNGTPGAGIAGQVVFDGAFTATPKAVVLTSADADGVDNQVYISALGTTSFQLSFNAALGTSEAVEFYYWVMG